MKTPCVVIDAGHGGHDPGAVGPGGLQEKDVALAVCMMLAEMLRKQCRVVLTRDNDSYVTLAGRAMVANEVAADALVSVHCNSGPPGQGAGFEVWTTPGKTPGDALATALYEEFAAEFPEVPGRPDMSDADPDKEAGFAVIRLAKPPAALFELEFIHTEKGESLLRNPARQNRMAKALARGVRKFLALAQPVETPARTEPAASTPAAPSGDWRAAWEAVVWSDDPEKATGELDDAALAALLAELGRRDPRAGMPALVRELAKDTALQRKI